MDALIGYTGLVGSYLLQPNMDVYRSTTIQEIRDKTYDTIYCAGLPAAKWKANKDPEQDYANMKSLMDALSTVTCRRFILISTVDVYDCDISQSETPDICPNVYARHPYGQHRRMMEEWCMKMFPRVHIFRLPALFGHGLKKNALYDMIHSNETQKLRGHWAFQWYSLEWLVRDIETHVTQNHSIVNLITQPLSLKSIQTLFFPNITLSDSSDSRVSYHITSQYGYSHSMEDVFVSMARYIRFQPRYLVSEIGWSPNETERMRALLKRYGIMQEEIVPSKRDWDMAAYTQAYSAQSLLYGIPIQIFQEQDRFLEILRNRVEKLRSVGVSVLVFGSPTQRFYSGEDALSLFQKVGNICADAGILFCIENNARAYGGNWLHTVEDVSAFVREVGHPNVRMNLDTGSMLMEEEVHVPDISLIGHVQISFPKLSHWNSEHEPALKTILQQLKPYTGHISLEVLSVTQTDINAFMQLMSQE